MRRERLIKQYKFNKDALLDKYTNQLSDVEDRMEELSRIPEDEFDEESVQKELEELKRREEELEKKIEEVENLDRDDGIDTIFVN